MSFVAGQLDNLAVTGDVGNLQVEGHAALLRSLQVSRSAQLQVGFGNLKPVVGLAHDVDALACLHGHLIARHKDAEALVGTSSHPAAQLVEL